MRSRVEGMRQVAELALRTIAFAALVALLWRAIRPPSTDGAEAVRGNRDLDVALSRWTVAPAREMQVVLDRVPNAPTRDWARALARAGESPLRWSSARALGVSGVVTEPAAEPNGATRV